MKLALSVVICSVNRPEQLVNVIRALNQGVTLPSEIIVILGPGSDESIRLLSELKVLTNLRVYLTAKRNLSWARNLGIHHSLEEVIAFIDDDAIPEPNWVEKIYNSFSNPNVGLVGGYTRLGGGLSWQQREQIVTRLFNVRSINPGELPSTEETYSPLGANFAIRRALAMEINGFDNFINWWGEEADFAWRTKATRYSIYFEPSAVVHHFKHESEFRNENLNMVKVKIPYRSRTYLMCRHAKSISAIGQALAGAVVESIASFKLNEIAGYLESDSKKRLSQEIFDGIREGSIAGMKNRFIKHSGLNEIDEIAPPIYEWAHLKSESEELNTKEVIAFVYREDYGDNAGGISNWIQGMCETLGNLSQPTVFITFGSLSHATQVEYRNGSWTFRLGIDLYYGLEEVDAKYPADLQTFGVMARNLVTLLTNSFGISRIVVPNFEGIGNIFHEDLRLITSLHTSTTESLKDHPYLPFNTQTQHRIHLIEELESRVIAKSRFLLANSNQIVQKLDISKEKKCIVLPHGVKMPEISVIQSTLTTPGGSNQQILFVGRWEPRKGSSYLPLIFENLLNLGFNVRVIGGDPFNRRLSDLSDLIKEFPNSLQLDGVMSRPQLNTAYLESVITLVPSVYESFGLVAIEAMSFGCGVVAFSGSGIEEAISESRYSRLVPVGEMELFTKEVVNLALEIDANQDAKIETYNFVKEHFDIKLVCKNFIKELNQD